MIIARVIPELFKNLKKDQVVSLELIQAKVNEKLPGVIILPEHLVKFADEQGRSMFTRKIHKIELQKGVRVFDLDEWLETLEQSLIRSSPRPARVVGGFVHKKSSSSRLWRERN